MNAKKHGKVTMALAMIGGLAALSIAYAAISTQLNIQTGDSSEQVEASAVMFKEVVPYGVSPEKSGGTGVDTTNSGIDTENDYENSTAKCANGVGLEISGKNKEADTVTINGTVLRDYGAFAVYKLTIENKGNTAVKLTSNPNSNAVTQFTGGTDEIKKNITIGVYSENRCNEKVEVFSGEAPSESTANYIKAGGSAEWYVKVAHRAYGTEYSVASGEEPDPTYISGGIDTEDITSGSFGFTITPVWENVPSAP